MASLGKDTPDRIVSYLRSHPDVDHVALLGQQRARRRAPAALQAAGLAGKVKIVGQSADTQTYHDIEAGQIKAVVPFDYYTVDYLMLDALARHFAGAPVQETAPPLWLDDQEHAAEHDGQALPGRRELSRRVQAGVGTMSALASYPISSAAARQLERPLFGHVIDGEVVPSLDGATMPIIDPATGEQVATAAAGSQADVERAVRSARAAFDDGRWRFLPPLERERRMRRLAAAIAEHADELAEIDVIDSDSCGSTPASSCSSRSTASSTTRAGRRS